MIMVRRNELACRDEWSRSFWAPREGDAGNEPTFQRPPGLGPAAPANPDDMRALLMANSTIQSASAEGEDVLLSEGRIISEHHEQADTREAEPPLPEPERLFPAGGFDPRTAVIRAREAYRERTRAREAAARQSAGAEAVPALRGEQPAASTGADKAGVSTPEPVVSVTAEEPLADVAADMSASRYPGSGAGRADEAGPRPEPLGESWEPSGSERPTPSHVETAWPLEGVLPEFDSPLVPEAGEPTGDEPDLRLDRLDDLDEQNLPAWFRTDLPRICRACRDYRPSAEGERGWCGNAWAFTHRRLVHEDDIAPCDSAIGDWWVPVDDVWLVAADVSAHGRATPLLDRLTGRATAQRRRS